MAAPLAKATVAAIGATVGALMAPLLAPLAAEQAEQRQQIAGLRALLEQMLAAPVVAPEPAPTVPASGCVVTVTSVAGTAWRWDATAAALGLRAMAEVPGIPSLRLVVDLWAGGCEVACHNDVAMREGAGPVRYGLRVELDGVVVLDRPAVEQRLYTWWSAPLGQPKPWQAPSRDELVRRGLVAPYAQGAVAEEKLAAWAAAMADPAWHAPWSTRGITQYMPGTGGRDDIGPLPAACAAYLICGDRRALDYAVGQAEAAGGIPWHMWDAARGDDLSAEGYPFLWTDGRGGTGKPGDRAATGLTVQIDDAASEWRLDSAHQPDLYLLPYLMTGRRVFLDGLMAQAAWNVLNVWPSMRGPEGLLVMPGGQVRHSAWALRQIDEAAGLSPEGSYLRRVAAANWSWLVAQLPLWTAQQGETAGWIVGSYGEPGALPPWQQDYFAGTALAAARRGNADALTVLRWMRPWLVGRFAHLGRDGCTSLLAAYDPDTGLDYQSWDAVRAATKARGWANGDTWDHSQGDYAQLARFTLLGLAKVLDDAEAAYWAEWLVEQGAPFVDAATYLRDPLLRVEASR